MDNQTDSLLDFFNLGKEFKKVTIQGSQTGGRVLRTALDEPPPETNDAHVNNEPLDYYEKYREAEKERMIQSATSWYGSTTASVQGGARSFHAMSGIESDTLVGSVAIPSNDMHDDHIDLSKQFNFRNVSRDAHQLPICAQKEKIIDFVQSYPVVVISGFTGCGKTTQVPQYILDKHAMEKKKVNIIVTQPRRLVTLYSAIIDIVKLVELRTNANRTELTGFLAGLGPKMVSPQTLLVKQKPGKDKMEETHSYFPEHDIEVQFDVEVGNDDINVINKIRYWINQALSKSEEGMSGLIKPQTLFRVQKGIQGHLKTLLEKDREFFEKEHLPSGQEFRWNLLNKKHRMPSQLGLQDKYFLKMIDGVNLQRPRVEETGKFQDITERLIVQYNQEGESRKPFHIPLECHCCPIGDNGLKVRMQNPREVYIHNRSEKHLKAEAIFSQEFPMSNIVKNSIYTCKELR